MVNSLYGSVLTNILLFVLVLFFCYVDSLLISVLVVDHVSMVIFLLFLFVFN